MFKIRTYQQAIKNTSDYRPLFYEEVSKPIEAICVLLGTKWLDWMPLSKSIIAMEFTWADLN